MEKVVRGIRNNNPLNLRKVKNVPYWKGEVVGYDKDFSTYKTMAWGIRAAMLNMVTIIKRNDGKCTFGKLIRTWAPSNENDTNTYVRVVCHKLNVDENDFIDSFMWLPALAFEMALVECGYEACRKAHLRLLEFIMVYNEIGMTQPALLDYKIIKAPRRELEW